MRDWVRAPSDDRKATAKDFRRKDLRRKDLRRIAHSLSGAPTITLASFKIMELRHALEMAWKHAQPKAADRVKPRIKRTR